VTGATLANSGSWRGCWSWPRGWWMTGRGRRPRWRS